MSEEYKNPIFKKWLDTLQQESWQLELIISGFALYALFSAFEPIEMETKRAIAFENSWMIYLMTFLVASLFILILNLTTHVILRGLWIGAIGLRYVSGEIDYDQLRYSKKFREYLENRVGSFDKFIANLEKYCSVIFAYTFLTVFYILSLFLIFGILFQGSQAIATIDNSLIRKSALSVFLLVMGLGSFLVFIDFVTQGWLKRVKWLSKLYYPFYRLFNIITLAFVYRPIVYNLLDHKFGRRLYRSMIPIYILIIVFASLQKVNSNYIPANFADTFSRLEYFETIADPVNYEDELGEDGFARFISIPSKTIIKNHLRIFIPFNERIEEVIYESCPELIPENDRRGIMSSIVRIQSYTISDKRAMTAEYLKCFASNYTLQLNDSIVHADYVISQNRKGQSGFETVISIRDSQPGSQLLSLILTQQDNSQTIAKVPFWYYPD